METTIPCLASISRKKKSTPKKLQARPEKYAALNKLISTCKLQLNNKYTFYNY